MPTSRGHRHRGQACYIAILSWTFGRMPTTWLARATTGSFQITTGGFKPYQHAIVLSLGAQRVDFAQLVKIYVAPREGEQRYSPAECTGAKKVPIYGNSDPAKVCTSHV